MPLQPGDVLSVQVTNEPQLGGNYFIQPEGTIELPMIGPIQAGGRTIAEITEDITARLARFVINPRVTVIQIGSVSRTASILGAVRGPGSYDLRLHPRLLSMLAAAGGPTPEADLERVVLIRGDQPTLVAAVDAAGAARAMPHDVMLLPGDTVFIPSLVQRSLRVVGAVGNPGIVPLQEGMTASRAVLAAGGPVQGADLRSVQLLRGTERISLDLRSIVRPEGPVAEGVVQDTQVQLDDIIVVPQAQLHAVHVIGSVQAPGPHSTADADRASKAVALAGGPTVDGDLARAYILREGARIELDLRTLLRPASARSDEVGADAPLEPGDVVVVPQARPVFVLGAVHQPGSLPPDEAHTVTQALFGAGGITADADSSAAYIIRAGEQIRVELKTLLEEGNPSADIALQPEDALIVPSTPQVVHLVGQVERPGPYPITDAPTVADLWALTGGALPSANMKAAVLLRDSEPLIVDVQALVEDGAVEHNRALKPGDTLLIPRIREEVYIFGEVGSPGTHPIHEGDTVIDVLAYAGGPTSAAKIGQIALIRRVGPEEPVRSERIARQPVEEPQRAAPSRGWRDWRERHYGARPTSRQMPTTRERQREQAVAEKIQAGDRQIHLFDLAEVRDGDPAYLARPGDVLWIPPRSIRHSLLQEVLRSVLINAPLYAIF
jgi:protein involved in polysaccharide export with SLBB domain